MHHTYAMDNDCLAAPIPDEAGRLHALSRYQILDSPGEADYDDFTLLATLLCGTPIALISLVDAERQWFKSQHGLDVSQTARSVSFCAHAILSDDLLEVTDATLDPRFADNPLVTGAPHIRFYAGAPLITPDGFRLGTLCVIDTAPRQLAPTQRAGLMALARQVMRLFESRRSALEDKARANFQSAVLDSAAVAIVASDNQGLITSFNRGAEQIFGYQADAVIGRVRADVLHEPALLAERWQSSQQVPEDADFSVRMAALAGQSGRESDEWMMRRSDGSRFPVRLSITPISGVSGASIGTLQVAQDISIAKAAQAAEARTAVFIRKIASQVPGVIYQFRRNPDGSSCFPYASERLFGLFQVDPADAARDAMAVLQKLHPDDLLAVRQTIEQSAVGLTLWRAEFRVVLSDRSQRWVEGNAMPERLDDGALLWHGVFSDITARKAAELALRESQGFLSTLIDTLPVGVYTKSLYGTQRGQYLIWNPAQAQISGVPAAQVVGRSARQAFPPLVADAAEQHDAALRAQRSAVELPDYRYLRPDDQLRRLRTRSVPIVGSSGEVEYVLGITEDMTESVRQQSELRIQQAEALAASDASPLGLFRADRLGE
ncbi:MAG: PAS domain S-box protein, partial [Pseudomonadota bacterium]|nr:PAS domain S-box protein [Pseudomonadota bacterium]